MRVFVKLQLQRKSHCAALLHATYHSVPFSSADPRGTCGNNHSDSHSLKVFYLFCC